MRPEGAPESNRAGQSKNRFFGGLLLVPLQGTPQYEKQPRVNPGLCSHAPSGRRINLKYVSAYSRETCAILRRRAKRWNPRPEGATEHQPRVYPGCIILLRCALKGRQTRTALGRAKTGSSVVCLLVPLQGTPQYEKQPRVYPWAMLSCPFGARIEPPCATTEDSAGFPTISANISDALKGPET